MDKSNKDGIFAVRDDKETKKLLKRYTHIYCGGARCETDNLGYATPENRSQLELVIEATNGFIPLWAHDVTLRYRFQEQSLLRFQDPQAVKSHVRELLGSALLAWDYAVPVRFQEATDHLWDFEIVVKDEDNCNLLGCTLARAFFPDAGQHELVLFPRMFSQSQEEQIETMAHELGHVFGLRHFFAKVEERAWPSEMFGKHSKFSIMNYGENSTLTEYDKSDLARLYQLAWSGELTEINGTPIRLMQPFSHFRSQATGAPVFATAAKIGTV